MTRWYRKRRPTKRRREFCCFPCVVARSANCPAPNSIPFPQWHNCQCKKCRRARCTALPPPPVRRRRRERNDGTIPRRRRRKTTREREQGCARTHAPQTRRERCSKTSFVWRRSVFVLHFQRKEERKKGGRARKRRRDGDRKTPPKCVKECSQRLGALCAR